MSGVISILERIGTDAALRLVSKAELDQAMTGAGIDPELRQAILIGDQRRLEELLGATTNVCCGMHAPSPDDDEGEEEEEEEEEEDEEDQGDKDQKSLRAVRGRVGTR